MITLLTTKQTDKKHQEDLQRLQRLRPIDDDFMRCLFKDNVPLAELVLRILTNKKDLIITECETQKDMKRLVGARSICLDAYGTDSSGKRFDLEIQRQEKGADPHRARYHSSVLDIENLNAGQEFKELPDTYTIFIIEKDFYEQGEAVYPIEDGEHILYVNGEYRGETEIGKLMHDFNCTKADEMHFELLAARTRYLKENPKGVQEMCKVMEDMRKESLEEGKEIGRREGKMEGAFDIARKMLRAGKYALDEIAECVDLSLDEIKRLKIEQNL